MNDDRITPLTLLGWCLVSLGLWALIPLALLVLS